MTVQTVPYALQNASHSAALFRQAMSAPFTAGGALGALELVVRQQASPNMSVILGPGRAKIPGTAVSPPAGQSWTTQAMYDSLNDADVTLTVAASNPTQPRIDVAYMGVNDSFYSGALNTAVAGIVTGTPAASPVAPAVPSNAIALYYIAVAAGATSIVNANLSRVVTSAKLISGGSTVADLTVLAAVTGMSAADQLYVTALKCAFIYSGSAWVQSGISVLANAATRDTEYAKASAAYRVNGATVYLQDAKATQTYNGTNWRGVGGQVQMIPTSAVNGTIGTDGTVTFTAVTSVSLNGCFTAEYDNYLTFIEVPTRSGVGQIQIVMRLAGTDATTGYAYERLAYTTATAVATVNAAAGFLSMGSGDNAKQRADYRFVNPCTAVPTGLEGRYTEMDASFFPVGGGQYHGSHVTATAYDGYTLKSNNATTMTGTIRVYAWNN